MAAFSGCYRLCAFSNISRIELTITRRMACRNLHSFSKFTSVGDCNVVKNMSQARITGHTRSTLFSATHGSLSGRILAPVVQRSLSMFGGILSHHKVVSNTGHLVKPLYGNMENIRCTVLFRNINIMSKRGKRKTCKAVAKRVHRTGKGKLKRWRAGKNHGMIRKSNKRRKQLKKATYCNKQQLKLLNKMLNGW